MRPMAKKLSTFWVFVHGVTAASARGAQVEIVEARRRAAADHGDPGGGGYWWAEFLDLPARAYTVRVTYPGGSVQSQRVALAGGRDHVRFDEDAAGHSSG